MELKDKKESDKIDLKAKLVKRYKQKHFIVTKEKIY